MMKKFLLFSLLGLFVLCTTGCQSKEDTCCLVTISADSDATIKEITLEKPKKTLGYTPGKYFVPYGKIVKISFEVKYENSRGTELTKSGTSSTNVNQAKELDIKVGSYYEGSSIPTLCDWVGGERSNVY